MMEVPPTIIQRINAELGISGQPHQAIHYYNGEKVETGCTYWPISYVIDWLAQDDTQEIDRVLAKVRKILIDEPVIAYKGLRSFIDVTMTEANGIVVAPTTDQFDIVRIEQTNGADYALYPEDLINKLMELDKQYGIDIVGANNGVVEFLLEYVPEGEKAIELGKSLLDFCPDLMEAPTHFPGSRVALWWD
jgi:hypothetical protein